MQNFPKKLADVVIKKIFIPMPGCVLCNADAKGAEVRVFAAYSKDEELIKSINSGQDTHSYFTAEIYPDRFTYEYIEQQRRVVDDLTKLKSDLATTTSFAENDIPALKGTIDGLTSRVSAVENKALPAATTDVAAVTSIVHSILGSLAAPPAPAPVPPVVPPVA